MKKVSKKEPKKELKSEKINKQINSTPTGNPGELPLDINIAKPVMEFIGNTERIQNLSLEGIVDGIKGKVRFDRPEVEAAVLFLIENGYVKQKGNHTFEVTKKGAELAKNQ